ncbi:MAG: L,D-transpeptidase [Bryobacteraceae bacterium]|jgi:lipoprotein-anchoring transpeptidase ErfK/SrfK
MNRKLPILLLLAGLSAFAEEKAAARRIVVSIPDHKLALLEGDKLIRVYDVATGKLTTPSPEGEYRVVSRVAHPTWFSAHKVVQPGPANPLGTRWLGLSIRGYGIHGTNVPQSIGKYASHGCIRMRNKDVEDLFERVQVGTPVELVGQPTQQVARVFAAVVD